MKAIQFILKVTLGFMLIGAFGLVIPYYIWTKTSWSKEAKILISLAVFVPWLAMFLVAQSGDYTTPSATESQSQTEQISTEKTEDVSKKESAPPEEETKQIEKPNLEVASQIVKRIDGKCRYFFSIQNKGEKDFNGGVAISLHSDEFSSVGGAREFTTTQPMQPGGGTTVYFDRSTCPPSLHGTAGINKYTYVVKVDDTEVGSGEGKISDKFEDMDAYDF